MRLPSLLVMFTSLAPIYDFATFFARSSVYIIDHHFSHHIKNTKGQNLTEILATRVRSVTTIYIYTMYIPYMKKIYMQLTFKY